jgi:hypothetical protein
MPNTPPIVRGDESPTTAGEGSGGPKMPAYNPQAVEKAINSASRYQGKVSKGERTAIHRLLKGRR